jgi:ribonuclease BN (tRNA processing enzyme)
MKIKAKKYKNRKPTTKRITMKQRLHRVSTKIQIFKAKKRCISVINEFAEKGERRAYVYLSEKEIRVKGKAVGPPWNRRTKRGPVRKDYVRIDEYYEYDIEKFLLDNKFRVEKYKPSEDDTPEKIKSIFSHGPFRYFDPDYYYHINLWVVKF